MNRVPSVFIAAPLLLMAACELGGGTGPEADAGPRSADASTAVDAAQAVDSGSDARDAGADVGHDASVRQDAGLVAGDDAGAAIDGGSIGDGSVPSTGCGKAPTLKSSPDTTINYNSVTVNGTARRYILRLPANYDNSHPYRLILSYHWATGSASQVFNCHTEGIDCYTTQSPFFGQWDLSDNSTIFIAPDGIGGLWSNTGGQDVTFTDAILAQVEADSVHRHVAD